MTIITQIELVNFKSHKNTIINFRRGRVVILGENGAGKSSIEQGISYALFAAVDGFPLEDLVGTGGTMFKINLEFEVLGKKYRVERENGAGKGKKVVAKFFLVKPGGAGLVTLAEGQDNVSDEILHVLGTGESNADLRKYIVVPQNQIHAIISETPRNRKTFFDALFGISDYEDTRSSLYTLINIFATKLEGFDREICNRKGDVELLPKKKEALEQLKREIADARKTLEESSRLYTEKYTEYSSLVELGKKITTLKQDVTRIDQEIKGQELQLQEDYRALNKRDPNRIPLVKVVTKEHLEKLQDALASGEKKLEAAVERKNEQIEGLKKLQTQLGEKQEQSAKLKEGVAKLSGEVSELEEKVTRGGERLSLKELPREQWVAALNVRVKTLEKTTKALRALKTSVTSLISSLDKAITSRENLGENIRKDKEKVETVLKTLDKKFLKGTPIDEYDSGLQKTAAETVLPQLDPEKDIASREKGNLEKEIAGLETERKADSETLGDLEKVAVGGTCSACHQPISEAHRQEEIARLTTKIKSLDKSIGSKSKLLEKTSARLKDIEERIKTANKNQSLLEQFRGERKRLMDAQNDLNADEGALKKTAGVVTQQLEVLQETTKSHAFIQFGKAGELVVQSIETELDRITEERDDCNTVAGDVEGFTEKSSELKGQQEESKNLLAEVEKLKTSFSDSTLKTAEDDRKALATDQRSVSDLNGKIGAQVSTCTRVDGQQKDLQQKRGDLAKLEPQFDQDHYSKLEIEVQQFNTAKIANQSKLEILEKTSLPEMKSSVELLEKAKTEYDEALHQQQVHSIAKKELENYERFFRDIQGHIRRRFVQQTSREATNLLRQMVEMPEFSEIRISEGYDLEVFRYNKFESLTRLSGGEKMVMSLAIRIAIASRLGKQDLILLDEPTESLDTERIHSIVDCFERFSPLSQIFIITHDPEFERIADQVIKVSKGTGHSVVEVARE